MKRGVCLSAFGASSHFLRNPWWVATMWVTNDDYDDGGRGASDDDDKL